MCLDYYGKNCGGRVFNCQSSNLYTQVSLPTGMPVKYIYAGRERERENINYTPFHKQCPHHGPCLQTNPCMDSPLAREWFVKLDTAE